MALKACRECGRKISTQAKSCPHCGIPHPVVSMASMAGAIGCLGAFLLLLVFVAMAVISSSGETEPQKRDTMAMIQCRNFVRDRLNSPSTADFPFLDYSVTPEGSNTFLVKSYVDASNRFGATVRSNFNCRVRYVGGDDANQWNWRLVDLQMQP